MTIDRHGKCGSESFRCGMNRKLLDDAVKVEILSRHVGVCIELPFVPSGFAKHGTGLGVFGFDLVVGVELSSGTATVKSEQMEFVGAHKMAGHDRP